MQKGPRRDQVLFEVYVYTKDIIIHWFINYISIVIRVGISTDM